MCHFGLPGQFGQDGSISYLCMGWLQPHAGGECGAKYYATKESLCIHKGSLCSFLSANSVKCTGWNKTELGVCVDTCACVCLSPASTSVCQSKALFNAVDTVTEVFLMTVDTVLVGLALLVLLAMASITIISVFLSCFPEKKLSVLKTRYIYLRSKICVK